MRSMCVGVAETGVNAFLFLSFSFFSDKRKEHYKKGFFNVFRGNHPLLPFSCHACQAERGTFFFSTNIQKTVDKRTFFCYNNKAFADMAQQVEHILGKDEVTGSNPVISSSKKHLRKQVFFLLPFISDNPWDLLAYICLFCCHIRGFQNADACLHTDLLLWAMG